MTNAINGMLAAEMRAAIAEAERSVLAQNMESARVQTIYETESATIALVSRIIADQIAYQFLHDVFA